MSKTRSKVKKNENTEVGNSEPVAKRKKTSGESEFNNEGPTSNEEEQRIGRIERVQLINFMCHANFIVEFNKNINIFYGSNGSGKSAIITAIVIGLGGNAAAAERSKNIAQLIRRGETSASIEITLYNDGIDSYENDKYGNRIIVHRQINATGGSQYRLKSSNGEIISRSLSDLHIMLMYMNIQVDNPICVLNQDAARSFLKEADPKKRHLLFSKATQLEKIIQLLDDSSNSYRASQSKFGVLQQKLVKQIQDYNETKEHFERLRSVETLKEELRNFTIELEWSKVKVKELNYEEITAQLDELNNQIEELKNSIESWADDIKKFDDEKKNLIAELNETKVTISTQREAYNSLRNLLTDRRNQMIQQETKYKGMNAKLKRLKKDISEMQSSINDRHTLNSTEKLRRENEEKLGGLIAEREENQSTKVSLQKSVEILDKEAQETESALDELQHKHQDVKQKMEQTKREINQINVQSTNNLSIFGDYMPKLIALLEQHHKNGKFSELPRGPIGRYVQVKNEKWSRLVEHILKGQLTNFIFNTHEDSKYFDTLIKREFPQKQLKFSKIVTKFCHTPYNVSANKVKLPKSGSATILQDEIVVSDPIILNVLIDQIHIETILMCSGDKEACLYTTTETKIPKNLSKVFSLSPAAEYFPAPNFRSYGLSMQANRYLQTDMRQYKLQLEHELADAANEFESVRLELNNCKQVVKTSSSHLKGQKAYIFQIEKELRRLQIEIKEIENFEYPAEHEVVVLQNELKELQNEYETVNAVIKNEEENFETLQNQVKAIEQDIKFKQTEVKKLENIVKQQTENINTITEKIDNLAINNVERELKKFEKDKKKIEIEEVKQKSCLDVAKQKAADKGRRIDNDRDPDTIEQLMQTVTKKIKKRYASTDDIGTVEQLMIEREKNYQRTEITLDGIDDILQNFSSSREARYLWLFHKYRPFITLRIKNQFSLTLKSRKFGGEIRINHEQKTLEIDIVPQDKNIQDAVCNTKSLSGGERSFSTLAFLTSLWSCVASPFYLLDEYDVFTDQINRRFMAQLLIMEARRRSDRQFCFFTPQDMSFIDESSLITFHKLESHLK